MAADWKKERTARIIETLTRLYGHPECALKFGTPFELLVSVILSAQCTDKRVNIVTKELFKKYKTPADFADIPIDELKSYIHTCGFYNAKAASIRSAARDILDRFGGAVPETVEELITLRGVGKKTANVVFSVAFGGQAIAVDTHVSRLAFRIGFTKEKDPLKIERDLLAVVPEEERSHFHHLLITHGRTVCAARKPDCAGCAIAPDCERIGQERQT